MENQKKVLLIGSGAREHALAAALKRSPADVYAVMEHNNPGIKEEAKETRVIKGLEPEQIVAYAKQVQPNFAIIGPEKPLADGIVDQLETAGIPCIGPKKNLARIETSKCFARQLMKKYGIQGLPKFKVFTEPNGLQAYFKELRGDFVIKADGLRGGKGVKVMGVHLNSTEEAEQFAKECIEQDGKVLVEEKLEGQEFSLISFVDGKTLTGMIPVQDHKRAFAGDKGPNTGGMGSYTMKNVMLPFLRKEDVGMANLITMKAIKALQLEEKEEYKGIIYGGFMLTGSGVRLIEFNARFGDPEALNILPLLETPLTDICEAIIKGELEGLQVHWSNKATVCKYIVPQGYPNNAIRNEKISIPASHDPNVKLFYGSVEARDDGLYLLGSRAVGVVGVGETLADAEEAAEKTARAFGGPVVHREDIGTAPMIQQKVEQVRILRG